jgi:hypothetical protein
MVLGGLPVLDPNINIRNTPLRIFGIISANGKGQFERLRIEQSGFLVKINYVV